MLLKYQYLPLSLSLSLPLYLCLYICVVLSISLCIPPSRYLTLSHLPVRFQSHIICLGLPTSCPEYFSHVPRVFPARFPLVSRSFSDMSPKSIQSSKNKQKQAKIVQIAKNKQDQANTSKIKQNSRKQTKIVQIVKNKQDQANTTKTSDNKQ